MTAPAPGPLVIVLTTIGVATDVAPIARALVDERLAACVNVLPMMTSFYRWKGVVEEDQERQLIIKTTRERVEALQARVRELHPYDVPEFLVLNVASGSETYVDWVRDSVRRNEPAE